MKKRECDNFNIPRKEREGQIWEEEERRREKKDQFFLPMALSLWIFFQNNPESQMISIVNTFSK